MSEWPATGNTKNGGTVRACIVYKPPNPQKPGQPTRQYKQPGTRQYKQPGTWQYKQLACAHPHPLQPAPTARAPTCPTPPALSPSSHHRAGRGPAAAHYRHVLQPGPAGRQSRRGVRQDIGRGQVEVGRGQLAHPLRTTMCKYHATYHHTMQHTTHHVSTTCNIPPHYTTYHPPCQYHATYHHTM